MPIITTILCLSYDLICDLNPSKEAKYIVSSTVETIHFIIHIDGSTNALRNTPHYLTKEAFHGSIK